MTPELVVERGVLGLHPPRADAPEGLVLPRARAGGDGRQPLALRHRARRRRRRPLGAPAAARHRALERGHLLPDGAAAPRRLARRRPRARHCARRGQAPARAAGCEPPARPERRLGALAISRGAAPVALLSDDAQGTRELQERRDGYEGQRPSGRATSRHGKGTLSTESKALSAAPYSFSTRFEGAPGTNPEELLGAAHAGCFTMALTHAARRGRHHARAHRDAGDGHAREAGGRLHDHEGAPRRRRPARPARIGAKVEAAAQKAKANCPLSQRAEGRDLDGGDGSTPDDADAVSSRDSRPRTRRPRALSTATCSAAPRAAAPPNGSTSTSSATSSSATSSRTRRRRRAAHNPVDGHDVPVPHFGMVLEMPDWECARRKAQESGCRLRHRAACALSGPARRAGDDVPVPTRAAMRSNSRRSATSRGSCSQNKTFQGDFMHRSQD